MAVVDCHNSLLGCYGWVKVVFELAISKQMCDLKSVSDVVAHVMDEEMKGFFYGIITRSVMQRIMYCTATTHCINS